MISYCQICVSVFAHVHALMKEDEGSKEQHSLLIKRHLELHLSESTKVLGGTDTPITISIIVQQTVQCRGEL